jgi:hypothetical protein
MKFLVEVGFEPKKKSEPWFSINNQNNMSLLKVHVIMLMFVQNILTFNITLFMNTLFNEM